MESIVAGDKKAFWIVFAWFLASLRNNSHTLPRRKKKNSIQKFHFRFLWVPNYFISKCPTINQLHACKTENIISLSLKITFSPAWSIRKKFHLNLDNPYNWVLSKSSIRIHLVHGLVHNFPRKNAQNEFHFLFIAQIELR